LQEYPLIRESEIYLQPQVRSRGLPLKALVVDDDADVLSTSSDVFRLMGFEVISASSGTEAIDLLECTPDIEVLFTDVLMPGMSGVALGREARRLAPGIKVILISGFPGAVMDANAGEPGEFLFLMKPVLWSEVAVVLRR
jgi:DNA-binding NtrC family response regulator